MKKCLSILLILAMVLSLGATAFAEGEKDEPDLKTFLSEPGSENLPERTGGEGQGHRRRSV